MIALAEKHVHERQQEVGCQFLNQERPLSTIAGLFKCETCLSNIDDATAVARRVLGDKQQ